MPGYLGYLGVEAPTGLRLERMLQKARIVLGVSRYDTKEQIKAEFVKLARLHHPDTTVMAVESMELAEKEGRTRSEKSYTLEAMVNAKNFLLQHIEAR